MPPLLLHVHSRGRRFKAFGSGSAQLDLTDSIMSSVKDGMENGAIILTELDDEKKLVKTISRLSVNHVRTGTKCKPRLLKKERPMPRYVKELTYVCNFFYMELASGTFCE